MQYKPILKLTPPSKEQLPAVLSDASRIIVTAGAGTGKTRTLVARYLALLANGVPMRSIVAITFTRKAAREMRNRVRHEIGNYVASLDPQEDAVERSTWMAHYREIDGAHIGTIHALCGMILRSSPAETGLDPLFEVLDDAQGVLARADAIEQTLGLMADDDLGSNLFTLLSERVLLQLLQDLLTGGQCVRDAFDRLPESTAEIETAWQEALANVLQERVRGILALSAWHEAAQTVRSIEPSNAGDKLYPAWVAARACTGNLPDDIEMLSRLFETLTSVNLQGGSQGNWGGKESCSAIKEALKTMREIARTASIETLEFNELDRQLAEHMPALRKAYRTAAQLYNTTKERQRAIDYDDLEQYALRLLMNSETVAVRWQDQVKALLVDEFQDTNATQLALVEALCGPRTSLFCVGDAKQSIYAFRGADVAVFRGLRQSIVGQTSNGNSLVVDLNESYRGHQPLVKALNTLLEPVLGTTADAARPWREPFAGLIAHRQEPGGGFDAPHIELEIVVGPKSGGADSRAADALALRLSELVNDDHHTIQEDGQERPLNYGDIAVLCRSGNAFEAYEDAFERAGLPFYTVAGKGFYDRAEVRDLLNALAAIADPTDDLALCGLLRSPAIGASDAALFWLYGKHKDTTHSQPRVPLITIFAKVKGREELLAPLSPADRAAVEYGLALTNALHQEAGRVPVDQLISRFLAETGYLAALERAGGARSARNLQKLVRDAQSSGLTNLSRFLRHIDQLKQSDTREGEARAIEEGSITLMSVHGAKGLEFPVVAIGDAGYSNTRIRSPLIDDRFGPVIKLSDEQDAKKNGAVWEAACQRQSDMDAAESQRLLYVAATRARELLIVNGATVSINNKCWFGMLTAELDGLSDLFKEAKDAPEGMRSETLVCRGTEVLVTLYGSECVLRLPAHKSAANPAICRGKPPLLGSIHGVVPQIDEKSAEEEQSPPPKTWRVVYERGEKPNAWALGAIVHDAIAGWVYELPNNRPDMSTFIEQRAHTYGVIDNSAISKLASQARAILDAYLSSELHHRVSMASRREHEVAYAIPSTMTGKGDHELGIVDLMFQEDGRWHIVEFKTDRLAPGETYESLLASSRNDYCAKLDAYAAAAAYLLDQDVEAWLCFLRPGPALVMLSLDQVRQAGAGATQV